jgi:hypothetical protein
MNRSGCVGRKGCSHQEPRRGVLTFRRFVDSGLIGISVWQGRLLRLCVPDRRGTLTFRAPKPQRVNYVNPLGEESPCSFSGRIFAMASGLC